MLDLLALQSSAANPTLVTLVYTLLLCFILSSSLAYVYEKTFLGLSYSRNFVQSLVLSSLVAATVMQATASGRLTPNATGTTAAAATSCVPAMR